MSSSLQEIILKLQEFWAAHGCLIAQPYYTQVGAGTMNPATFLRVLGPEPWNVAYVEPSVRPDDGRYGENPNRFQQHTQFQVILKPDPGNPVELYLQSLEAIGVEVRQHDIRLVEDNWEQPAISAWGLGWEIWLDGQEITQFTYFQQVGGVSLDPISVEITYGLERILIALNNASSIWDEPWVQGISYGEVRQREEYEHSRYYFEIGDVDRLRQMYDLYRSEAEACLEDGLVAPAHDFVLKCSHTFNALDCRGAIGVTERQVYYTQMRAMARRVAERYLEQRKELEYPLLKPGTIFRSGPKVAAKKSGKAVKGPAAFVLEIGVEEIPAADLDSAIKQLEVSVPRLLAECRLEHGQVRVEGTPRRLAVMVDELAGRQADREELVKGPPAERAFDASGKTTPAAEGFARGKGVSVKDLEVREVEGGRYVFVVVKESGRPTVEVLAEALPGLFTGLRFDKSMRWLPAEEAGGKAPGTAFTRPIRWLVSLYRESVVAFQYAGLRSGRVSRGLRPFGSPEINVTSAEEYPGLMEHNRIILSTAQRQALILQGVKELAGSVKGEALVPEELLREVANLVECPLPLLAGFSRDFLTLPKDVLISVMMKQQRTFPVVKGEKLLPHFIVVRNGDDQGLDLVRQGNEHVVRARFADADFFIREDLKHKPEHFRKRLETLTFQKALGSMLAKNERIERLTAVVNGMLDLSQEDAGSALKAAHMLKFDLATRMVTEMTSLQGIIGGLYAQKVGESQSTSDAIREQYLPVPRSLPGVAIALADRLDSLAGLFAAGMAPTGTKDPFALRRAAIGVVQTLIEHDLDFDLRQALQEAGNLQPVKVEAEVLPQVQDFITGRLRGVLLEASWRYDVVEAVLSAQSNNPAGANRAARQLHAWVGKKDWGSILPAYARCARILRAAEIPVDQALRVDEALLTDPAERSLHEHLQNVGKKKPGSVDEFLGTVKHLVPTINTFFDKVLVMAEEVNVRQNRLVLVGSVARLAEGIADLSRLEGF